MNAKGNMNPETSTNREFACLPRYECNAHDR